MIEFSIPDSAGTYKLNCLLLTLIKEKPQMFYDDFVISSTYGAFNGTTWNGGRDIFGILSEKDCKERLQFYNSHNVSYRYTFTNKFIEKRDLFDRYSNMMLRINNNGGVTYNKKIIKDYIKKKYKNYYFVSSCTRNIKDIKNINKISKKELIVLDFKLNNSKTLLKLKHPENVEIVVNEQCFDNCPFREIHYSMMAQNNMFLNDNQFKLNPMCNRKSGSYQECICSKRQYVSRDRIYKEYLPLGINKFKLVGRHNSMPDLALMGYLDYFVKPEYQYAFISLCKMYEIIGG
jgi:hypothetical protein